jgi:purine-binding chemotaxis protein CheW
MSYMEDYGAGDETDFATDANQFLTFTLGAEQYGLPILRVQEIKGISSITPIPGTPPHIKGVINLRGNVIPVLDLRERFRLSSREYDKFSVIVVVSVGDRVLGLVVDAVSDVLNIDENEIIPPPELGSRVDTSFMTGMAKAAESLVLLLDIDAVVSEETITAVTGAAH